MSIKVMVKVWDQSKQKGSKLLLLLAIADHAGDDGFAWPGIIRLAKKTRMSERHVSRMIKEVEKDGELIVNHRPDIGRSNQYLITVGQSTDSVNTTLAQKMGVIPGNARGIIEVAKRPSRDDNLSGGDDIAESGGDDIAESSESSCNHQLKEDAGASIQAKPKTELMNTFLGLTNLTMPKRKSDVGFWWSSIREIYAIAGGDIVRGTQLLCQTVVYMQDNELMISSPNSLLNPMRSIASQNGGKGGDVVIENGRRVKMVK